MFAAISQSDAKADVSSPEDPVIQVNGRAEIRFKLGEHGTCLDHLYHHDPVRIVFPTPAVGDIPQATVITTSGGLTGGDKIAITTAVKQSARAMVASQAAEKIYRSAGRNVQINVTLAAESDAWLEYLPQETILFDGARLARTTSVDAMPGSRVLAGEIIVFGRRGSGESFRNGFFSESWRVRLDNRLTWADTLVLKDPKNGALHHPAGFDGAVAMATAIYLGPDASMHLDLARNLISSADDLVKSSATIVNGVLVIRFLGREIFSLRTAFGLFWQNFRHDVSALPAKMPRLWEM